MSRTVLVAALAALLAGCASSTPPVEGHMAPAEAPRATPAGWAVSIASAPFVIGFKGVVCVASVVVAAPIAGLLALDPAPRDAGIETLGDGIASNCGPPWVISPYDAS